MQQQAQGQCGRRPLMVVMAALAAGLAAGGGLTGCASLLNGPRTVEVSQARLLALMSERFPRSQRYLDLFDVTMAAPRLRLLPEQNRIGTEFDYALGASILSERQMKGTLGLSYGLRFEPSDATVRLSGVKVEKFDLAGLPRAYAARAPQLGRLLAEELLQDLVVHRFDAADLRRVHAAALQPGALKVLADGLRLQLEPVAR